MTPAEGNGRQARKASKASIAAFDAKNSNFDLMQFGTGRLDDYEVQKAFESAYPAFDSCVADEHERTKNDARIEGEITLSVQVHPTKGVIGVNADGPKSLMKRKKLVDCMRDGAAAQNFGKFDGPPQVAEMTLEVEP